MKRIFLFIALVVSLSVLYAEDYKPLKRQQVTHTDSTTNDTYTIQNIKYPIFKSKNGAFYIWKISKKTNKKYKYYLPKEIQKQLGREYKENK